MPKFIVEREIHGAGTWHAEGSGLPAHRITEIEVSLDPTPVEG